MESNNSSPEETIKEVAEEDRERYEAVKAEVDRKTDSIYIHRRLSEAEHDLKYWQTNRDVIREIITALEETAPHEIGDAFFSRIGELLTRIGDASETPFNSDAYADILRRRYEAKPSGKPFIRRD